MIAGRRFILSSLAAVAALILVPAAASAAANRYATPTGGATSGSCDLAAPCTIDVAIDSASNGDDVTLLGGVPPAAAYSTAARC